MAKKDEQLNGLLKELVIRISGKGAEPIVNILFGKKNINEFKIAEKLGTTINQARNILYKLSDAGIMSSIKKKDKKKGWYTYFWTLEIYKALKALEKIKLQEIDVLQKVLKNRKMRTFYFCQTDNIEMSEETALHHNFLCPECGQLLQPTPKEKKIKEITSRIEATRKALASISEQLEKHKPKIVVPVKKVRKPKKRKPKLKPKKPKKKIKKKPKKKVKKKQKVRKPKKKKVKKVKAKVKVKKKKPKKKKQRKK